MMNTSKLPLLAIYFVVLLVSTTYAQPYIFDSVCRPNDDVIVVDNDRDPEVIAAAYANIFQSQVCQRVPLIPCRIITIMTETQGSHIATTGTSRARLLMIGVGMRCFGRYVKHNLRHFN